MPFKANADRRHHIPRQRFRITNWYDYDASLRGRLTVWFTDEAIASWKAEPRTTRGGQPTYSGMAILTALTLREVFGLALRQTEGLIGSVMGLLGLDLAVPDHSTLSRRAATVEVPRPRASPGGGGDITRLTGITAEMVAGQAIDLAVVRALLEQAELVIAHNAKFDRAFCERLDGAFRHKAWACSVAEVPWAEIGFEGAKLGYLVNGCGWFHHGHRAVDDCHALLEVLAHNAGSGSAFMHLLSSSARTRVRVWAEYAPFDMKDVLKRRGYRWFGGGDGQPKAWWTEVDEEDLAAEMRFLKKEVYLREVDLRRDVLTAYERYRPA